jgi:hypothetical protein
MDFHGSDLYPGHTRRTAPSPRQGSFRRAYRAFAGRVSSRKRALWRLLRRLTWSPSRTYHPPLLCSKGIGYYCDFAGPDFYRHERTESCQPESFFRRYYADAGGLVWVRLGSMARDSRPCDLDHFVRSALPFIRKPFVLITTDGDASVPSDIKSSTVRSLLDCPWLVSWYTQNYDGSESGKFARMPIGLDLHTPRFLSSPRRLVAELENIRSRRVPPECLPARVFCDLEVSLASAERHEVVAMLRNCGHVDFLKEPVSQRAIWRRYAAYPFVISAAGNGLDCHRTWELLYLGSIVITKTSPLDRLFDGLPVVTVKDWREICDRQNLSVWLGQYGGLTDKSYIRNILNPERLAGTIRETLQRGHLPSSA